MTLRECRLAKIFASLFRPEELVFAEALRLMRRPDPEKAAGQLTAMVKEIEKMCKDIYRLLTIDGYARIDLRLTADNRPYFIEANPNPHLAAGEDFAQSALKAGLKYPQLIQAIIGLGMRMARG